MKKFLVMAVLLAAFSIGCETLSFSDPGTPDRTAHRFVQAIERSQYEQAYDLLSRPMHDQITEAEFIDLMETMKAEFGKIEEFDLALKPFAFRDKKDTFPYAADADTRQYTFDLQFSGHKDVTMLVTTLKEDNVQTIGAFNFSGSTFSESKKFRPKYEQWGNQPAAE